MSDRTALVVGGTSGIGLATARRLHALGADVHIAGRSKEQLDGVAAGIAAINAAVEALVKPLAAEFAPIRVNGVSPGFVDTPWWSALPEEARQAYFAQAAQVLPVRRIATADDIAEAVVLAATNSNLTGTMIEADGGARFVSIT
jgi:NAD(P)-dependent dehydrogenase (short-subunit alcohol dehydrogenase family)